jgi:hypothetical protein
VTIEVQADAQQVRLIAYDGLSGRLGSVTVPGAAFAQKARVIED